MVRSRFSLIARVLLGAALWSFLAGASAYAQCPTNTQAASPSSPVNTTLIAGSKTHYKWNLSTASNVTGYEVYVRQSGANGTGVRDCSALPSADSCDGSILTAGNYEWMVRTLASNCSPGFVDSSFQPFVVTACSAPPAPTLTSPANNTTITTNPPTLQWTAVSGAGSYDIHINNTVATSSTNSFTPPTLAAGNYTWYVEAIASCSNTQRTRSASTFAFTVPTATCPDAATLQTPAEGSTVPSGAVTLSWKPSTITTSTAPTYLIFAGINGATPAQAGSTTNTQTTFTIDASKTIEWYVVTRTTNCPDVTSAHGHFTTSSTCPTAGPTITAPASGSSFDDSKPITINWTAVSGATSYDILVSSDNGANFTQKATLTSAATSASLNFAAGSYVMVVRANATNCPSMISQPAVRFTVLAATTCPTTKPTLVSPANSATVTLPVTFDWSDVDGASGYNLYVVTSNSASASVLVGSSTKSELTVTSLPSGTSAWFVQALFDNCSPTESAHNAITINASSSCSTAAASLVSPANNSTISNPVTFDWSDVSGATGYRLVVAFNGGSPIAIAASTDSNITSTLPAGAYEWYVEALYGTACPAIASTHFKFTLASTNGCSTTAPTIVSPSDGATNLASPVTLQWSAVSGAIEYKVFASINGTTALVADTTSTSASVKLPTGSVTWFVEALFSGDCAPTVSKRASFTVTTGSSCANNAAPALQSPQDNATNVKSPVTFQWQNVDGATGYTLFVAQNGDDFVNFGTTTDHQLERILAPGTFTWYVAASFAGCDDTHSPTFHFTVPNEQNCPTGTITLNAPADGATVTSPVAMSWTAITGATSYRVHVSSNGEAFAVLAHPTTNSASVTLPSGSAEWYVEALFNANATTTSCPSILSNRAKFTVSKAATCDTNKAAVATAPSGTTTNDEIDFTWNAAAGAVAYRVWLAPQGQPFGDVGFTTNTHLSRDLDPGTYSWYVESFFSGCPTLNSNTLTFTINTPRCSNDAATLISPSDGATNVTSPVTLLWSAVPNAESYRVFASLDEGQEVLIGETDDTSITKSVLPGKIKWRVETIFDDCPSTRSKSSTFTVPKAQNCSGDSAQLVAPVDGASLTTNDVDLIWNAVSGAKRYIVFIRHNDGAATAIAETEDTHKQMRLPDGKIEWWIVTFVSGCPVTESSHATFSITTPCDNQKPLLQSPRDESSVTQPVIFNWTAVANATGYRLFVAIDDNGASLVDTTTTATRSKPIPLPNGIIRWFVEATFSNCPNTRSALGIFRVVPPPPCGAPAKPLIEVAATVASASTYNVRWTNVANADQFELQESSTPDFTAPATFTVAGTSQAFTHTATTAPVIYFYRARAISNCSDDRGAFSNVVSIVILPPKNTASTEAGNTNKVVTQVFIPGSTTPLQFTAKADKPWITITPSSGTLPTAGITLTVTSDPGPLNLGTNTGTISISFTGATSNRATTFVTAVNLPVSVSLVTPVSTGGKNTPPPDSLIIPAVGHASGVGNSLFESDVRLANISAQIMKYQLNFTPAGSDGTQAGSSTQIQVDPGSTMALNDIMANFFGGGTGSSVGTLEIRPLTSTTATGAFTSTSGSQSLTTVVSSRTYNSTTSGTFGQFIPGVPFSQFIAKSSDQTQKQILSLQQIAQNSAYRTNFGIVEGAGEPVSVLLSVFDSAGNRVGQIPETLPPGGFLQFNSLLEANGITLADGRIEVEVTSDTGRVTAYASVLDNITSDPLLVSPVNKTSIGSNRYILPGIGDFDIGIAHWKSDVRIYNAGATRTDATLTYYPQGAPGSPRSTTISIDPGETKAINDFIATEFPMTGTAGSLVVSTASASSLVASARTYTDQGANKGTYGQFIPAVTPDTSTSLGGRTLQVLQLEASDQFRSNIGLVETSGSPVSVEVSAVLPDSRVTPKTTYNLAANEFRQISLGVDFGLSNVYNVRVAVRVTSGTGKVTAYGSVIDATTQDPTFVPAQ
jgi:hypothetical protein